MRFDIITIFPQIFNSYFSESIIKRAKNIKKIKINVHNLRDFAKDKHRTTDDTPYGGGAGMVMKIEPIYRAIGSIKSQIPNSKSQINSKSKNNKFKTRVVLFSAKGKQYTQTDAKRLSKYDNLILICGRYEGVDERVAEYIADEEISIGNYVLTGGEIPAMILVDSITRLLPGVLGNVKSLEEESFSIGARFRQISTDTKTFGKIEDFEKICEYPQYTKPEIFFAKGKSTSGEQGWKVPKVLLSGNHKKIKSWRKAKATYKK